ncbi:MAG: ABC transporter ATP-binding protein [Gammaproteobacteria bacterium]|nr:ABC transporter ATP-binding protein [Gammaproteobacteria bacterium]
MSDKSVNAPDSAKSAPEAAPLLRIEHLSKAFRVGKQQRMLAVDDVSFDIPAHSVVGLVGESGSGKTTLGKLLMGLHSKTAGAVYLHGERLPNRYRGADFRRYGRHMQMIFQDPYGSLNPRMTVEEILTEPLRLLQLGAARERRDKVVEWLLKVNLHPSHLSRYPHEFSGGQRQRIGIARALITAPDFVVCDEPVSALDVSVQAQIINLLGDLQASMGLTLLFIAHDLSMVRHISATMVVMYMGSIVEQGPAEQVFTSPRHPYTRALIEAIPIPDPELERQRGHRLLPGEVPSPLALGPGCRFAGRCSQVMPHCRQQRPPLLDQADGSRVACFLYD